MLKLVLLGAGSHSQGNHLPALARYVSLHPEGVRLVGLCDLRQQHAEAMARRYGFERVYVDLDEMLRQERPDGCIAVTPIPVTTQIAARVLRAGVPLLMEKPPGATVEEARQIVHLAEQSGVRAMVSMNRRFDPALRTALKWKGSRPLEYVRATILRRGRREPDFMQGTAIHPLDTMREIAGDVLDYRANIRQVGDVHWFVVRLTFKSGALGTLDVLPTVGSAAELYEIFGSDYHALVRAGGMDSGQVRCWENDHLVVKDDPARGMPGFVRNGTYDETVEFITALKEDRAPHPSPVEVLQSVELCHRIAEQVSG